MTEVKKRLTAKRKCKNWLSSLSKYVEDTESPRHFWLWSGIFILGSSLQRRVWLPFGMETIFPNHYIMLVAPPGWCRKGAPVGFAKKILEDISIPVGIDSPTKRHLTKKLASLSETEHFFYKGFNRVQSPLALVSKELSSFLAVDLKGMIEALTDLYDCHDKWDYGTSGKGEDFVRNVCIGCFFASTPDWMAKNLPEEAIGGGFTSRYIIVSGSGKYKEVSYPPLPDPELYKALKHDLEIISRITGEVRWGDGALALYDEWYKTIIPWAKNLGDDRLFNNFSRIHTMAIKTAICLHIARDNELVIEVEDMKKAITLLRGVFDTASEAFGSHGRSPLAIAMDKVIKQVKVFGTITVGRLLKINYRDVTKKSLMEILENLETMGIVKLSYDSKTDTYFVNWKAGKR